MWGLIVVQVLILGLCLAHIVRIQFLGKAVRSELRKVSDKRLDVIADGGSWEIVCTHKYPDINQSYKNLKWYKPWERPSTLVVFDKE